MHETMSLPRTSIDKILQYLEPHLDSLQTGFPNSTRPNVPPLTADQKRQKIETVLVNSPSIFLTKWGSVILYPRPVAQATLPDEKPFDGSVNQSWKADDTKPKDILNLFAQLAKEDYEIRVQLVKLYQQQQQLSEHKIYQMSKSHATDKTSNTMDMEEFKMELDENDLFSRSVISESTRRNRRLNYLLRYLAPPDPSEFVSKPTGPARGTHSTSHSSSRDGVDRSRNDESSRGQAAKQYTPLSSILSISGSMSNLSFSDSTYFSDAEMQARAPELYQQYIGQFIDGEDSDSSDTIDSDDETEGSKRKSRLRPFYKDISLVDRILWTVDNPSHSNLRKEQSVRNQMSGAATVSSQDTGVRQKEGLAERVNQPKSNGNSVTQKMEEDSESEFEEEFDTESETEDNEPTEKQNRDRSVKMTTAKDKSSQQDYTSPSISRTLPQSNNPNLFPEMPVMEPKESGMFGYTHGEKNSNSDDELELSRGTANRKEDQEVLRRDFVLLMKQRFLDGNDQSFDYSTIDFDENLDDLDQENYDGEDRWFDSDSEDLDSPTLKVSVKERTANPPGHQNLRTDFDARVKAWESGAQNGAGDYDY